MDVADGVCNVVGALISTVTAGPDAWKGCTWSIGVCNPNAAPVAVKTRHGPLTNPSAVTNNARVERSAGVHCLQLAVQSHKSGQWAWLPVHTSLSVIICSGARTGQGMDEKEALRAEVRAVGTVWRHSACSVTCAAPQGGRALRRVGHAAIAAPSYTSARAHKRSRAAPASVQLWGLCVPQAALHACSTGCCIYTCLHTRHARAHA